MARGDPGHDPHWREVGDHQVNQPTEGASPMRVTAVARRVNLSGKADSEGSTDTVWPRVMRGRR